MSFLCAVACRHAPLPLSSLCSNPEGAEQDGLSSPGKHIFARHFLRPDCGKCDERGGVQGTRDAGDEGCRGPGMGEGMKDRGEGGQCCWG